MTSKRDDLEVARDFDSNKITFNMEVTITEGMLHDQLTSAIESSSYGSSNWAEIKVGKHKPGWANYFTATFKDRESGEVHKMTRDKLIAGLKVLHDKYPHHYNDVMGETGDAITGDVLVQCALLGNIVYS